MASSIPDTPSILISDCTLSIYSLNKATLLCFSFQALPRPLPMMRLEATVTFLVLMVRITHGVQGLAARVNFLSALTNSQSVPRSQGWASLSGYAVLAISITHSNPRTFPCPIISNAQISHGLGSVRVRATWKTWSQFKVTSRPHLQILKNCYFTLKILNFYLFFKIISDKTQWHKHGHILYHKMQNIIENSVNGLALIIS